MRNLENRKTTVSRNKLLAALKENRVKHEADFLEAVAGFREIAAAKIEEQAKEAQKELLKKKKNELKRIAALSDVEIPEEDNSINLILAQWINLDVPKSYLKAYDTAIDMFTWEVNETVELTYTEFNCFILDEWEWKEDFIRVSNTYKSAHKS